MISLKPPKITVREKKLTELIVHIEDYTEYEVGVISKYRITIPPNHVLNYFRLESPLYETLTFSLCDMHGEITSFLSAAVANEGGTSHALPFLDTLFLQVKQCGRSEANVIEVIDVHVHLLFEPAINAKT